MIHVTRTRMIYETVGVYACSKEKNFSVFACENSLRPSVYAIDEAVLGWIRANVLTEKMFTRALDKRTTNPHKSLGKRRIGATRTRDASGRDEDGTRTTHERVGNARAISTRKDGIASQCFGRLQKLRSKPLYPKPQRAFAMAFWFAKNDNRERCSKPRSPVVDVCVVRGASVSDNQTTREESEREIRSSAAAPIPGLVVVFAQGRPTDKPIRLDQGPIEFGRGQADGIVGLDDDRASRRHVRVALGRDGVRITDLGSRNGTFVDGRRISDELFTTQPRVLRVGYSLVIFTSNIRGFVEGGVQVTSLGVAGPSLRTVHGVIARTARSGGSILLTGPSGAGKELAARCFHESSERKGRFVAINCATIPSGLAERLLFGARKGAYSGATTDTEGHVQAADGGTLFLDEIAELDIAVQPKLLRVLETREVVPLGASHSKRVDLQICAATLKDMRSEVTAGRFREDLYFRIGRPEARLPALGERLEEIAYLIDLEAKRVRPGITVSASFVEACLMLQWPGNVRELMVEVRHAVGAALAAGRELVEAQDLSPLAGRALSEGRKAADPSVLTREQVENALRNERGNVSSAARALGLHRTQLRRLIERYDVDVKTLPDGGEEESPRTPS